jgi:hypothetical protein
MDELGLARGLEDPVQVERRPGIAHERYVGTTVMRSSRPAKSAGLRV